jgi:hypothetical protein
VAADYDTIVQCKHCGKRQYLKFANGLKNGWDICCKETMPILVTVADIDQAVKSLPISVRVGK